MRHVMHGRNESHKYCPVKFGMCFLYVNHWELLRKSRIVSVNLHKKCLLKYFPGKLGTILLFEKYWKCYEPTICAMSCTQEMI